MNEITRRGAIQMAAGLGLSGAIGTVAAGEEPPKKKDRDLVMECGMTAEEADCWELTAKCAGKFFELPKLHPTDAQEVATAIHVIQNKLLSRPTYRKYLELAKGKEK